MFQQDSRRGLSAPQRQAGSDLALDAGVRCATTILLATFGCGVWLAGCPVEASRDGEGPSPPAAKPWSLSLEWDAPQGCPDAAAVRHQVRERVRNPRGDVEAMGVVTRDPLRGHFVLALTLHGAAGTEQRRIEAESCDAIAEVVGLLIAVAADPTLSQDAPLSDETTPATGDPAVRIPTPVTASPPKRAVSSERTIWAPTPSPGAASTSGSITNRPGPSSSRGGFVRVDGAGQMFNLLPRSGLGLGGAAGMTQGRFRLELRAHYFVSQREVYPLRPEITGDFDLWTLGAASCWEPSQGSWSFPLCGGAEAGVMRGRTSGVREPGDARAPWAAFVVDGAVTYSPIAHLALWAGPQGVLAAARPRFHVRDLETLFRAGPAGLRLRFGVEVRFP